MIRKMKIRNQGNTDVWTKAKNVSKAFHPCCESQQMQVIWPRVFSPSIIYFRKKIKKTHYGTLGLCNFSKDHKKFNSSVSPIKQTHCSAQTPSFSCFFLIEIIVNTSFFVPFWTVLSQLQSNYLIHSLAHSINTICHSQVSHQKLFLQGLFFPSFGGNVGSTTLVCQELRWRKLLWVTSWPCLVLHHTKSSQRPPHPGSCSSQPRLGSNWTMEFTSSRATGHHISVGWPGKWLASNAFPIQWQCGA